MENTIQPNELPERDELHEAMWTAWTILLEIKDCYNLSSYLHSPTSDEELSLISSSHQLQFIRYIFYKETIISLYKLYHKADNNHFNLPDIIEKLKSGGKYEEYNATDNFIKECEKEISDCAPIITNLRTLRSKFYAHTDKDRQKYIKAIVKFEDINMLIGLTEKILRGVYALFEQHAKIENGVFDKNNFPLMDFIIKYRKGLQEEIKNKISKSFEYKLNP